MQNPKVPACHFDQGLVKHDFRLGHGSKSGLSKCSNTIKFSVFYMLQLQLLQSKGCFAGFGSLPAEWDGRWAMLHQQSVSITIL